MITHNSINNFQYQQVYMSYKVIKHYDTNHTSRLSKLQCKNTATFNYMKDILNTI